MSTRQYIALDTHEAFKADAKARLEEAHQLVRDMGSVMLDLILEIDQHLEWNDLEPHSELRRHQIEVGQLVQRMRRQQLDLDGVEKVEADLPPPETIALPIDDVAGSW